MRLNTPNSNKSGGRRNVALRLRGALVVAALVATLTLLSGPGFGQGPVTFRYLYDDAGKLTRVLDSTGISIEYVYDPVGNIQEIRRSVIPPGALTILDFFPKQGATLSTVTIQGQGFSPVPSANTVMFNGTPAPVISADSNMLLVGVPAGATTGLVTISVAGDTASSATPFLVQQLPVITFLAPKGVFAGTTISIGTARGLNLSGASFAFLPEFSPPAITVTALSINTSGTAATFSLSISAVAAGNAVLVATTPAGSSTRFPTPSNTIRIFSDPFADEDGDGAPNGLEALMGTDLLNPDTDGDGFSDGVESTSFSDPLDPASTPLTGRKTGEIESPPISLLNGNGFLTRETESNPFSLLNGSNLSLNGPRETESLLFSLVNAGDDAGTPHETSSPLFSLLNVPSLTLHGLRETESRLFSLVNGSSVSHAGPREAESSLFSLVNSGDPPGTPHETSSQMFSLLNNAGPPTGTSHSATGAIFSLSNGPGLADPQGPREATSRLFSALNELGLVGREAESATFSVCNAITPCSIVAINIVPAAVPESLSASASPGGSGALMPDTVAFQTTVRSSLPSDADNNFGARANGLETASSADLQDLEHAPEIRRPDARLKPFPIQDIAVTGSLFPKGDNHVLQNEPPKSGLLGSAFKGIGRIPAALGIFWRGTAVAGANLRQWLDRR